MYNISLWLHTGHRVSPVIEYHHAADGSMTIDADGTIASLNPAAVRIFGFGAAALAGQPIAQIMPPPHADGSSISLDLAISEMRLSGLIMAAQAARLLGARVMLTSIRPEVAQTLVGLGLGLSSIVTHSTRQSGIADATGQRRGVLESTP